MAFCHTLRLPIDHRLPANLWQRYKGKKEHIKNSMAIRYICQEFSGHTRLTADPDIDEKNNRKREITECPQSKQAVSTARRFSVVLILLEQQVQYPFQTTRSRQTIDLG